MPESLAGASAQHRNAPGQPVNLFTSLKFRLFAALVLLLGAWFIAATLVSLEPFKPLPESGRQALIALAMIFAYACYVRWVERRACQELHWRAITAQFLPGFFLACGIVGLSVAGLLLLSNGQLQIAASPWCIFKIFAELALLVLLEEVICRGLILRLLANYYGVWLALLISAVIYGALHSFNHGASYYTASLMALGQGICLGAAYLRSANLSLCFGLHLGWNVIQGGVFSIPVSGQTYDGWLRVQLHGPDWLTGAAFGLEASALSFTLCTCINLILLYQFKRQSSWQTTT